MITCNTTRFGLSLGLGLGLVLLGSVSGVWAEGTLADRGITLNSQTSITSDSNFFLADAGQEASERIANQTFGIKLLLPLSLQTLQVDYSLSANKHQHFASFDRVDNSFRAALQWAATPRLSGSLYTARAETANAPQDSLNPTLRNQNTTTSSGLSASYGLFGPWQLQAAVSSSKSVNEQALLGSGDSDTNNISAGVRYAPSSQSSIGYSLGRGTGTNQSSNAIGALLTSASRSTTHQLQFSRALGASTTLLADLQHQTNEYDAVPAFNFSGWSGGLSTTHAFSPKTSLAASLRRSLASKQTAQSVYSQTQVLSLNPLWQASPKISLSLPLQYSRVSDQGGTSGTGQVDRYLDYKLLLSWQPRPFADLGVSVQRAQRNSSVPLRDYTVQRLALDADLTF